MKKLFTAILALLLVPAFAACAKQGLTDQTAVFGRFQMDVAMSEESLNSDFSRTLLNPDSLSEEQRQEFREKMNLPGSSNNITCQLLSYPNGKMFLVEFTPDGSTPVKIQSITEVPEELASFFRENP